jgi:hypothetical protein
VDRKDLHGLRGGGMGDPGSREVGSRLLLVISQGSTEEAEPQETL